jgi:hypothetical protein
MREIGPEVTRKAGRRVKVIPRRATFRSADLGIDKTAGLRTYATAVPARIANLLPWKRHTLFLGRRFRRDLRRKRSDDLFEARIAS